jgi:adenylate kinase
MLAEKFAWQHFSTGDLFKSLREGDSELAKRVRESYDSGRLLPDWFATYLFEHTLLNLAPEKGVVCEGYPRSRPQAEIFDETLSWLGRDAKVFNLNVSEEETMRRQIERAKSEHRPDSATPEQIQARFAQYNLATEPVLEYFRERGLLIEIDGERDVATIHADIVSRLS